MQEASLAEGQPTHFQNLMCVLAPRKKGREYEDRVSGNRYKFQKCP